MPETQTWTIKRLLDWTTQYFADHGSESSRLEAEILLAEALGCQRIELYTRFDEVPTEPGLGVFRAWVKRRAAGEPVAYLVGHREFYSLKFHVDANVLIPRPETEHLVVETIEAAKSFPDRSEIRIADVGTGSGCVAVAVAKHVGHAHVTAIDISEDALKVAAENIQQHALEDRVDTIESDLFANVPEGTFDIIVSNPPYVGENEVGTLDENVRQYEPAVALFGGTDGLQVIERLLEESLTRLNDRGYLIFELSPIIVERCQNLIRSTAGWEHVKTVRDLANHPRVIVARRA